MEHHHVILIPQADKIDEARDLLKQSAEKIKAKRHENGPLTWSASFDEGKQHFYVDAIFKDANALAFHQNNMKDLVQQFGPLMAAPPETIVSEVFSDVL